MPANTDLLIFYHLDKKENFPNLKAAITALANGNAAHEAIIAGNFTDLFCKDLSMHLQLPDIHSHKILRNYEIVCQDSHENWQAAANRILQRNGASAEGYVFFVSSAVIPDQDAAGILLNALGSTPEVAGVNPVFTSAKWPRAVAHMGTVADTQGWLHYLYEGIQADNPLVAKPRLFQLAHAGALMARKKDFLAVSGFDCALETLAFPDFCLRLRSATGGYFLTVPEARAVLDSPWDSQRECGIWNSLLMRGKLLPGLLDTDYPLHAFADKLPYELTDWLAEMAVPPVEPESEAFSAWLNWTRDPSPVNLMKFLKFAEEWEIRDIVELCRAFPSLLPGAYDFYTARAGKASKVAEEHNFRELEKQARNWQSAASRFHYRVLKPGMKLLRDVGIYNSSLDATPAQYDAWIELAQSADNIEIGDCCPKIALVMPVWNTRHDFLRMAIESVKGQTYGNWELCIANDASTDPAIRPLLDGFASEDKRIKRVHCEHNLHICGASNAALKLVDAPWTGFLDHDDMLARNALAEVAHVISNGDPAFIYTDEDHINEANIRRTPIFKPDFDFDLEMNFTGHLSCYETALIREVSGLRAGYEGSQDLDLMLRVAEKIDSARIKHIPKVLYHWRVHENSTSASIATKPYALAATEKALLDRTAREGGASRPMPTERRNFYKLAYVIPSDFKFSLVVLNGEGCLNPTLKTLINNLAAKYDVEIINPHLAPDRPWQRSVQEGMEKAANDIALFIQEDLEPLPECQPEQMAYLLKWRKDVAAIGAMLWSGGSLWNGGYYPNVDGMPFPLLRGMEKCLLKAYCWGHFLLTRPTLGFDWRCMAISRKRLGGKIAFDERMGEMSTCDFALRMAEKRMRVLVSPWGQWRAHPTREELSEESMSEFIHKWADKVKSSGLRNANLRRAPDNDWGLIF